MAHDFDTLLSLWTKDGVLISPDGAAVKGKRAIAKQMENYSDAGKAYQVVEYEHNFEEIKIIGEWAFEWGSYRVTTVTIETSESQTETGNLMRILKRQPDGDWKCARAIWNVDSADKTEKE